MLRVTIDLIPSGDESKKETLSTFSIYNTLKTKGRQDNLCVYHYFGWFKDMTGKINEFTSDTLHYRNENVLYLVNKIINSLLPD